MSCDSHTRIGIKGHRLNRKVPKRNKKRNEERKKDSHNKTLIGISIYSLVEQEGNGVTYKIYDSCVHRLLCIIIQLSIDFQLEMPLLILYRVVSVGIRT